MQVPDNNTGIFKSLQTVHRAMLLGIILFAIIAFYLNYAGSLTPALQQHDQALQVVAIVLSLSGFFIGNALFKKRIFQLRTFGGDMNNKLSTYRSVCLLQWILLEAPALFATICFLLVGNYAFLALAAALMILFAINVPTKIKMAMLLQIREEEIN
jgi:hypothetical protein